MTDFETFVLDKEGVIFRYFKYKRVWTPHEMEEKYSDESIYENGGYGNPVYIRQAIELPYGDILLKLENAIPPEDESLYTQEELDSEENKTYVYEKLSDISLEEFDEDNIRK